MAGSLRKEDLRIQKTHKALMSSMSALLEQRGFNQITVNDLCAEALISRATFYTHFTDKYDLLRVWLERQAPAIIGDTNGYAGMAERVNDYVYGHKSAIRHLVENANPETYELLCGFLLSLLERGAGGVRREPVCAENIVLSRFCSGGMMRYLAWQAQRKFPTELPVMNPCLYELLRVFVNGDCAGKPGRV